jgi:nucleoside-diphosphate-sugar epimerase
VTIARCYAFVGPYLNLDIHFAIGNFIRDGILKQPIIVQSDGTPLRSYLFGTDLAVWLWMILLRGKAGCAYNVGSDQAISIVELATLVSQCFSPSPEVQVLQKAKRDQPCARYIPDIKLAKKELGLQVYTNLKDSIENTIAWNQ